MQMFLDSLADLALNGLGMLKEILFVAKLWWQVNHGQWRATPEVATSAWYGQV